MGWVLGLREVWGRFWGWGRLCPALPPNTVPLHLQVSVENGDAPSPEKNGPLPSGEWDLGGGLLGALVDPLGFPVSSRDAGICWIPRGPYGFPACPGESCWTPGIPCEGRGDGEIQWILCEYRGSCGTLIYGVPVGSSVSTRTMWGSGDPI